MAVNFTKNQDDITKAWRHVVDAKDSESWSVFGYEGTTNNIKPMTTGTNGLGGMVQELNCSLIQYAFCRVIDKEIGLNKLVLINWQGDSSPLSRKGLCASHLGDVVSYFKGCTQTITIRNDDEATQEYLMQQIVKSTSSRMNVPKQQQAALGDNITSKDSTTNNEISKVGSSYTRTEISSDIAVDRKSFWQRQEEEEKERLLEEKKRAFERQAQFEKERKLREESEAKKLAETIKERDRIIEATRQAERRELTNSSQPNSIITNQSNADDDERVGRRSELIRLERNQETLSIISKGLIKNKRAIFENASQQQQQQTNPRQSYGTTRRSSGAMIAERLNNFKSLDSNSTASSSNAASVEKIANGIAEQVKLSDPTNNSDTFAAGSNNSAVAPVKREVETVKIIPEPQEQQVHSSSVQKQVDNVVENQVEDLSASANGSGGGEELKQNGQKVTNASGGKEESKAKEDPTVLETNGNNNHLDKSPNNNKQEVVKQTVVDGETILRSGGKHGILAKALYDYRASDETEISFDPDDIIGYIEKVDEGWWHGMVITGQYAGLSGLFPQNHVQEEES